ncbi:hypothetical protein Pcinc_035968 [Petrolisthes cinctipes]|uniref:C2H2-type domain-containing protein n=1 Tax=Petrolisthes cinctipes TaxID=88211 RepID=A0AAE1EPQ2_PETCI|nr:hypothetical protein Pcinc_035968 [Petrolisthes cinctipes]
MKIKQEESRERDERDSEESTPRGRVVIKLPMKNMQYKCEFCGEEYEFSSVVYHGLLKSREKLCYCQHENEEVVTGNETIDVVPSVVPTGSKRYYQDHSAVTDQTSTNRETATHNNCTMTQTLLEQNIKVEGNDFDMYDSMNIKEENEHKISDMSCKSNHSFECGECGKTFVRKNTLQSHMTLHNNEKICKAKSYECEVFEETFKPKKTSLNHKPKANHSNSFRKFACKECGKIFKNNFNLQSHMPVHTGEKRHKCKVCGETFMHRNSLYYDHMPIHTNVKPFKCGECSKAFSRKYTLKCHMTVHTGARNYPCGECDKAFSQKSSRNLHLRKIHKGAKKFECIECGKTFCNKSNFQSHLVFHSQGKTFPCDVCGKLFTSKSKLTLHTKIHTGENKFHCRKCGKFFIKKGNLKNHLTRCNRKFPCNICGKKFTQKKYLMSHTRIHAKSDRKFQCKNCDKNFTYRGAYLSHKGKCIKLEVHTAAKKFSCDECHKAFTRKVNLILHTKVHLRENICHNQCEGCGKFYRQVGPLKIHKETCQKLVTIGAKIKNEKDSGEVNCEEELKNTNSLDYNHKPLHVKVKPFKCEECGKTFSRKANLEIHQIVHTKSLTGERTYTCRYCSATFTERRALMIHKNKCFEHGYVTVKKAGQNNERRYKCIYCGDTFKHSNSLHDHIPTHTNIRPFKCDVCDKTFLRKYHLQTHQLVHTRDRNFPCKLCGKAFAQKSSLSTHLYKVHNETVEFECENCGKIFLSKSSLQSHIKLFHGGLTSFPCKACGKSFTRKKSLALHYRRCLKGEDDFQCEECGQTFTKISDLETHMDIH